MRAELADLAQVQVPRHTYLPHASRSERVLVVDDHPVNLKVAGAMLQRLGYRHASAPGGAEALQAIAAAHAAGEPFAVVLLDQHMPGLDGLDTARTIVQRWGAQAPVLIGMSASNLGPDHGRALDAGMREHLPKPLELERLARALRQWCPPRADALAPVADLVTPADAPALDPQRWQALAEYDDAHGNLRREIAGDFLTALAERASRLERAAAAGDAAALEEAAHGLRGAADNLGLSALGALCQQLETSAQQGRVDHAVLERLRAASEAAVQALNAALAALPRA